MQGQFPLDTEYLFNYKPNHMTQKLQKPEGFRFKAS